PGPTAWSQYDQVISVDDLVEALVAEGLLDLPGLRPTNLPELMGVVVDQPACELRSVELGQGHHRPRREFPFYLRQARGEQALAPLSQGLLRPRVTHQPSLTGHGEAAH